MQAVMKAKIEGLYEAFSDIPKPSSIDSCECCHTVSEKSILLTTPLRKLTCEQLWNYTFSVFNTIGDREDFLYFLPRILELTYTDDQYDVDLGQVGNKIYQSRYWECGSAVQSALEASLLTHFKYVTLEDCSEYSEVSDWVCLIGNAVPNVDPFLELLIASDTFKVFYDREHQYAVKGKLGDAFWEDHHGNQKKIVSWLLSDVALERYWSFYN